MDTIEELPSDQNIEMTELFHRLFNAGGCNPMCHCCGAWLPVGSTFKLSTVKTFQKKTSNSGINFYCHANEVTREVMLCEKCTPEKMNSLSESRKKALREYMASTNGGCFRVNGQIQK